MVEGNYAQLLPNELFEMIEKESLAINPIVVSREGRHSESVGSKKHGAEGKEKGGSGCRKRG